MWMYVYVCMAFSHRISVRDFVCVSARECECVRVCQRVRLQSSCADLHMDHELDSNLMCVRVFMCVFQAQILMWIINLTPT